MSIPFAPTPFASPVINPKGGGFVKPFPYLSVSQYRYAPTAMNTDNLVDIDTDSGPATEQDQIQALYNTINRSGGHIDRYLFGSDEGAKGASLCASQNIDDAMLLVMLGYLNLQCRFGPIISLDGLAIGAFANQTQDVDPGVAAQAVFNRRTIKVPVQRPPFATGKSNSLTFNTAGPNGKTYAIWSYTNGYAHTQLAADCVEGAMSIQVAPNGPGGGTLGILIGDNMSIEDASLAEEIIIASVSGTTLGLASPLQYAHTVPTAPDFIPVTALPADVIQASIFFTTALIKSRGDLALELSGIEEARSTVTNADAWMQDMKDARNLLDPYKTYTRQRS